MGRNPEEKREFLTSHWKIDIEKGKEKKVRAQNVLYDCYKNRLPLATK